MNTTTATPAQQPLTLANILKAHDDTPIPADRYAQYYGQHELTVFVGHIDTVEADRRLAVQDTSLSGLLTVRGDLTHRWAVAERHDQDACKYLTLLAIQDVLDDDDTPDPELDCDCDDPWYLRWVDDPTTPGAIPVTTAHCAPESW